MSPRELLFFFAELRRCSRPGHGPRRAKKGKSQTISRATPRPQAQKSAPPSCSSRRGCRSSQSTSRARTSAEERQRSVSGATGAAELKGQALSGRRRQSSSFRRSPSACAVSHATRRGGARPPPPPPRALTFQSFALKTGANLSVSLLSLSFSASRSGEENDRHLHRIIFSLLCDSESAARSQSLFSLDLCLLSSSLFFSLRLSQ